MTESETILVLEHEIPFRSKMTVRETILMQKMLSRAGLEGHGQLWQDVQAAKILVESRLTEAKFEEPRSKDASTQLYDNLNDAVATLLAPFEETQLALIRAKAKTPDDDIETGTVNLAGYEVPYLDEMGYQEALDLEQLFNLSAGKVGSALEQNLKTTGILVKYRLSKPFKWPELEKPLRQPEDELELNLRRLMRPFYAATYKRQMRKSIRNIAAQSPQYREALHNLGKELGIEYPEPNSPEGSMRA